MSNGWLDDLRSRMEGYECDIPQGLWDDLRDALFIGEGETATYREPGIDDHFKESDPLLLAIGKEKPFYGKF